MTLEEMKLIKSELPWGSTRKISKVTGCHETIVSRVLHGYQCPHSSKVWTAAKMIVEQNQKDEARTSELIESIKTIL